MEKISPYNNPLRKEKESQVTVTNHNAQDISIRCLDPSEMAAGYEYENSEVTTI